MYRLPVTGGKLPQWKMYVVKYITQKYESSHSGNFLGAPTFIFIAWVSVIAT